MRWQHAVCAVVEASKLHVKDGVGRGDTESTMLLAWPARVVVLVVGVG